MQNEHRYRNVRIMRQWHQFTPCICAYLHKTAGHLKDLTKGTGITYTVKVIHVDNNGLNDDLDWSLFVS